jgi:protein required for attachment to host cells
VIGGVGMGPQVEAFRRGTEIVIATPGRLNDHLDRGTARLDAIDHLVLDEADRMLDMGFKPQLDRILAKVPVQRQTLPRTRANDSSMQPVGRDGQPDGSVGVVDARTGWRQPLRKPTLQAPQSGSLTMRTWILLADAASARLYASGGRPGDWTLLREFAHPEGRMRASEILSDKPGRVKQSIGSRAAMEPPTPRKKVEADRFARELANVLDEGVVGGACERLVLVAPPAFIGVLREKLAPRVEARVSDVIEKDYLHLDAPTLRKRLEKELEAR